MQEFVAMSNESVSSIDLAQTVDENGFAVVPACLDEDMMERLCFRFSETTFAERNLLTLPIVRDLAASAAVRTLAEAVLGKNCFAVKGTFLAHPQFCERDARF
jgi:hypothetical protein